MIDALLVGQHARRFAQHRRLAHAGLAQQQDAFAGRDNVFDDVNRPVHGAAHAARQPDDVPAPVADGADAVQRPLDAGAVIRVERR